MAAGDRIYVGIQGGRLYPQPDATFIENEWGFDDGERKFLIHPNTSKEFWPQRNQADSQWSNMYVVDVIDREDESGLIELTVYYKGVMRFTGAEMKVRVLQSADTSMFTLPGTVGGKKVNYVADVPKPSATREYLTLTPPNLTGVALGLAATWLPALPAFSISFIPDPDEAQTVNTLVGWKLDNRSSQDVAKKVFLVREEASYNFPLA